MNILIACEFSGIVRDAFIAKGHNAYSCDIIDTEKPGNHILGDVRQIINSGYWDMMIAHPPCTHLAISGARWWKDKKEEQKLALAFVYDLWECTIPKICIENPVSILSTEWRKPDQIIQPYQFGHGETKRTCLWLYGLPPLIPTNIVAGRVPRVHYEPPSENRWKNRSRTYTGIAQAMAAQWG